MIAIQVTKKNEGVDILQYFKSAYDVKLFTCYNGNADIDSYYYIDDKNIVHCNAVYPDYCTLITIPKIYEIWF